MFAIARLMLLAVLLAVLLAGWSAQAQQYEFPEAPDAERDPYGYLNEPTTAGIAAFLLRTEETCGWLPRTNRVDCIRVVFRDMAEQIPRGSAYAPVREALSQAANRLDRLVEANLDTSQPARPLSVGNKPLSRRLPPARAIGPAAQAAVLLRAEAIIEEAETVLLRSAENSVRRQVHFQQIAAAIDSTKVLLRSG